MATQWGRKETVIWPPHPPIYTYGAVFMALLLMFACLWCRFTFGTTALMQAYTPTYLKTCVSGGLGAKRQDRYRLIVVTDRKRATHAAMDVDVVAGKTPQADGKMLPLTLSDDARRQGLVAVFRGPHQSYNDAALYSYLKSSVFAGQSLWDIYYLPFLFGRACRPDPASVFDPERHRRRKEMKYGRRLKGPVLLTPKEFNKTVQGDGIGFKTTEAKEMMRIPLRAEAQHIELMGDTGAGKTTLIMQILRQIQSRRHIGHRLRPGVRVHPAVLRQEARRHRSESPGRALPLLGTVGRAAPRRPKRRRSPRRSTSRRTTKRASSLRKRRRRYSPTC